MYTVDNEKFRTLAEATSYARTASKMFGQTRFQVVAPGGTVCTTFYQGKPADRAVRQDVPLSSGRIISHARLDNGAQQAIPTTGAEEMTEEEWQEYTAIIRSDKPGPMGAHPDAGNHAYMDRQLPMAALHETE